MTHHVLNAGPKTAHWGYFEAARAPVLHIASGDRVTITSVSGAPEIIPTSGPFHLPPELLAIHAECERGPGPHILTGPIHVEGARPGSILEVRIIDVKLRQDWAYNAILPLSGTLQDDFPDPRILIVPIDIERSLAQMPWGLDLPLSPFFGIMGTAPPPSWGRINSIVPRAHGGNLDNKMLRPGATLYLPVFNEGALFSCGDGHAAQGDGEVCITAIETSLEGTFEFVVREDLHFAYPRAETEACFMTMGMDPDLDQCAVIALRDMIRLLGERGGLSPEDAYTLCSVAADQHVTQTVNGSKGIHLTIDKALVGEVAQAADGLGAHTPADREWELPGC